jgi:hypothetical protein
MPSCTRLVACSASDTNGSIFIMRGEGAGRHDDIELTGASVADQDFIAHARQDVPRLVAEVERLRRLLKYRGDR